MPDLVETMPTVSVCICTRNRPDDLHRALASVSASSHVVEELIVSDDSTDSRTKDMVEAYYPSVKFTEGPRRGLGANRNNALKLITSSHVLFMDDDVILAPDFVLRFKQYLESIKCEPHSVIITGTEINRGTRVFPRRQSFLGFQEIEYTSAEPLSTIVINSTMFPTSVLRSLRFDDNLVYGYDEVDIAARATYLAGSEIHLIESAANFHFPSEINRDFYTPYVEASRIYVTFKKYMYLEHKPLKSITFLVIAIVHNLLFNIKRGRIKGLREFAMTCHKAISYLYICVGNPAGVLKDR